ncbi:MAG: glycosyltransferase [Campylobacterales bacterium]|nr:glycosyltransferase [Campylobacterales bacterium]
MKILYIHTDFIDAPTPASTFLINRTMSLASNHADVILIAQVKKEFDAKKLLEKRFGIKEHLSGLKVIFSSKGTADLYQQCKTICIQEKPDVLYTRSLKMLPKLLHLKKLCNAKVFFESHDYYMNLFQRTDISKFKNLKNFFRERLFLSKTDGLVCMNTAQKNLYQKHLAIPIISLSSGILTEENKGLIEPYGKKVLAYIGALDPRKKIPQIIHLMKFLPPHYELIIFGGKTEEEITHFNQLIKSQLLEKRVFITGWLTRQQMHERLKTVSLGLIPLEESFFNQHLTYPLKLSDYYKFNIPVLTNHFPSAFDYLSEGETGLFVDWDDYESTKNKILSLLEDEALYKKMQGEIQHFKEQNSIKINGQKLIQFFKGKGDVCS